MADSPDDRIPARGWEDPVLAAALIAQLERVLGPLDRPDAVTFNWLLPTIDEGEVLDVLYAAPTGLGLAGLEQRLRERFGSLNAFGLIAPDADEAGTSESDV
ncbi:hypothetical protein J421_5332 (plasmid) [Gemmatirosa kalamazoonensis]|uniref:Uncharacterized protein n=1 Tax=Gemmatirosa kalamazoonensis TaxID=861299 RepID=W0RQX6_9BACT|nr:hypothetical protein [Gemmatirosa kalamazoonensis]AHG92867.1 hypothetical protein J421_5332 [Gemmatirosa kalamazoonensis]